MQAGGFTTLSGGETFLVNLSLALARAGHRAVHMPIETLLLDEGCGTLDPATLADVLGTLGTLTSLGHPGWDHQPGGGPSGAHPRAYS